MFYKVTVGKKEKRWRLTFAECLQAEILLELNCGKLPSSLISVEYMHLYSMHDFNRLMSAMSIDGIWQNNLIYFEIRRNAASLFGIRIRIQGG